MRTSLPVNSLTTEAQQGWNQNEFSDTLLRLLELPRLWLAFGESVHEKLRAICAATSKDGNLIVKRWELLSKALKRA